MTQTLAPLRLLSGCTSAAMPPLLPTLPVGFPSVEDPIRR